MLEYDRKMEIFWGGGGRGREGSGGIPYKSLVKV